MTSYAKSKKTEILLCAWLLEWTRRCWLLCLGSCKKTSWVVYWPNFFGPNFWTSSHLDFGWSAVYKRSKKILVNIQQSWPHTRSISYTHPVKKKINQANMSGWQVHLSKCELPLVILDRGWSNGRWSMQCLRSCQGFTAVSMSNSNYFYLDHWNGLTASSFSWLLAGVSLLSANTLSSRQIWSNLNVSYLESAVFLLVLINVTGVLIFKRTKS